MTPFSAHRFAFATSAVSLSVAALFAGTAHAQAVAPTPTQLRPAVNQAYTQLMAAPQIQKLLEAVKADHERSIGDLKLLTEIEAPPFKEQKRAEAFLARVKALGLTSAAIDAEGNMVGVRKDIPTRFLANKRRRMA